MTEPESYWYVSYQYKGDSNVINDDVTRKHPVTYLVEELGVTYVLVTAVPISESQYELFKQTSRTGFLLGFKSAPEY